MDEKWFIRPLLAWRDIYILAVLWFGVIVPVSFAWNVPSGLMFAAGVVAAAWVAFTSPRDNQKPTDGRK